MSSKSLTDLIGPPGRFAEYDGRFEALAIPHITDDSREVQKGSLFVAIPGAKADGAQFIAQAVEKGAAAIVTNSLPAQGGDGTAYIRTENPRLLLARIASRFYPGQPAHIAAVTGTDGKTSTAEFTRQLWEKLGYKAAAIGTLGILGEGGKELYPGTHTTPGPIALHRILQELAQAGYTHLVMEASSHGLDQHRLDFVRLMAAAFTNLTRDHLDYHGDEEAYFAAKARLFSEVLPEGGLAVVQENDPRAAELETIIAARRQRLFAFGYAPQGMLAGMAAALRAKPEAEQRFMVAERTPLPHGQRVVIDWEDGARTLTLEIPQVGDFQVLNMLAALGLALGCGATESVIPALRGDDIAKLLDMLPHLKGVPGRLEHVATNPCGAPAFIDYAHTPTALAGILKTLRPHTQARLVCVFGCGGDRDRGKRPLMGRAASELADICIVTDDNPRSEDPAGIRAEIMGGCKGGTEIGGREEAIAHAVRLLREGDVLVVAGKGHEKTQTVGADILPFDDAEVIRRIVAEIKERTA